MKSGAPRVVAVLGVTGRLGPAVARAFMGEVRGLSRRAPLDDEGIPEGLRFVRADRRDVDALVAVIDGADAVVDLVGCSLADADALLDAVARTRRPPTHLVFASSIAVNFPEDPMGKGKREAQARYEERFAGAVHTLVLPRLVAAVDPARREQPYLDTARSTGKALVSGDGSQRQTVAPVEGVAAVIRALVDDPSVMPAGAVNVGPPTAVMVAEAVRALLDGAGLRADIGRHPDRAWRAPHGGADESLDTRSLREALPGLVWPDALETYRSLGRWLAEHPPATRRPLPVVAPSKRAYAGRRTCDVHDRRRPSPEGAVPAFEALASWITPAFYVDLGRPCNAACVYCSVPPHGDTEGFAPVAALVDVVKAGVLAGCERAILIGGEPTIHPELGTVLEMLRDAGFTSGNVVMTNGLRIADARFLGAMIDGGVKTLHVSVDTSDEAVYDRLSRSMGQFAKQRRGLANALVSDANVYVYTVVTRWNVSTLADHVRAVAGLARSLGREPAPMVMAFAKPIGDALTHAGELMLTPEERALSARELARVADDLGVSVGFRNLQPCLASELTPWIVDGYLEDRSVDLRTRASVPYQHDAEYVQRVGACAGCDARGVCPGAYRDDVALHGEGAYRRIAPGSTARRGAP